MGFDTGRRFNPLMQMAPPAQTRTPVGAIQPTIPNPLAQQQPQQDQNSPEMLMKLAMMQGNQAQKPMNPLMQPPGANPLVGSLQNPAMSNQGAMDAYSALEKGDNAAGLQNMMSSGMQVSPDWLTRNLGGTSFGSLFGF